MPRLTIDDLKRLKERTSPCVALRSGTARVKVTVHMGTCGIAAGAREVMKALLAEIERSGSTDVIVTTSRCTGLCSQEPMATVDIRTQSPVTYVNLTPETMAKVFQQHILGGRIVMDAVLAAECEPAG